MPAHYGSGMKPAMGLIPTSGPSGPSFPPQGVKPGDPAAVAKYAQELQGADITTLATLQGNADPSIAEAAKSVMAGRISVPSGDPLQGLAPPQSQPGFGAQALDYGKSLVQRSVTENPILQGLGEYGAEALGTAAEAANAFGRTTGFNALSQTLFGQDVVPEKDAAFKSLGVDSRWGGPAAPTSVPLPPTVNTGLGAPQTPPGTDLGALQASLDSLPGAVAAPDPIEYNPVAAPDFELARQALERGRPQAPEDIQDIRQSEILSGLFKGGMQGLTQLDDYGIAGLLYGAGSGGLDALATVNQQARVEEQKFQQAEQAFSLADAELERALSQTGYDAASTNETNRVAVARGNRDATMKALEMTQANQFGVAQLRTQLSVAQLNADVAAAAQNIDLGQARGYPPTLIGVDPSVASSVMRDVQALRAADTEGEVMQATLEAMSLDADKYELSLNIAIKEGKLPEFQQYVLDNYIRTAIRLGALIPGQ